MMLDIKISGGQILDGRGSPPTHADVGIRGEKIVAVGDLSARHAATVIDASGKTVCPGFIDVHSHSDTYLLMEPSAPSKVFQGVTTEVVGNCGASAAPLSGEYRMPSDWLDKDYPGTWRSVAEYRELLQTVGPAPNVVFLVGHNALRAGVVGYANRPPTGAELREMADLLARSMEEGARGMSSGLIYAPGIFARREELVHLAKVVARHGGLYASHIRNESSELLKAVGEALTLGREADVRVQISHLKAAGKSNWNLIDAALAKIRDTREEGVAVAADRYPYTSAYTDLDVIFPHWAVEGGRDAVLKRLREPSQRARLREDLLRSRSSEYWSTITIGSTAHPDNRRFQGMPLVQTAEELGMQPVDAMLHLVETDETRTSAFFAGMNEENMRRVLNEPYVMIGSDASVRAPGGPLGQDYPHPRAYGSFVRFLRMALDGKTVPLPEATRKMTSLPAGHFDLEERGALAGGMYADIVVFDPLQVRETTSYADPHQLAEGIEQVIVNGTLTLSNGKLTGKRNGRFL